MIVAARISSIRSFSRGFADAIYPPRCGLCDRMGEPPLCEACAEDFGPIGAEPIRLHRPEPLSWLMGAVAYAGRGGQAVTRLKYARITSLAEPMAARVAAVADRLDPDRYDLFVPVPIHWVRWCDRGFNQSELLCRFLPFDKVHPRALRRRRHTRPQASLPPERREANLQGAFRALPIVEGKRVVLVDDVVTSGTTARECAEALRSAGALEVGLIAFALAHP